MERDLTRNGLGLQLVTPRAIVERLDAGEDDLATEGAVAKYLAKVGIKVNLDVKPKSIYFTEVMENKHDFYMMGWFDGTYSGARTFFRHLHTIDKNAGFGDWNGSRSSDKDIDQVLEKTNQIVDKAQYVKTLQEANKMAMERVRECAWKPASCTRAAAWTSRRPSSSGLR